MTKEASSRIKRLPAEYETVTQTYDSGCPNGYYDEGSIPGGLASVATGPSTSSGDGPCVRVSTTPAKYETVTEQVLVKEASSRLEVVPATYETVTEQVMAKPASMRTETIPASYETVTEQVEAKQASTRIERIPAEYETVTETIQVSPASTKWVKKKADRNCLSADPNDCLVWCLVEVPASNRTITKRVRKGCPSGYTDNGDDCTRTVEVPAEYKTRTWRKLATAATTRSVEVPAEYKTISRKVVKTPASTRTVEIPAEYSSRTYKKLVTAAGTSVMRKAKLSSSYTTKVRKACPQGYTMDTSGSGSAAGSGGGSGDGDCIMVEEIPAQYGSVSKRVLKSPASTRTIEIPAEFTSITKRNLVKKGGFTEWREVVCPENVTGYTTRQIQQALKDRGYDPGPIDNVIGSRTKAALAAFQKDNGLPVGNLDFETMKALGVRY
ncbi:MAG: peptidoglycan-binding protein [Saprospiraceae bacterium]|nr:peptidoglycan-binding protein [Saprospiraceae bacterium]